jgi:hypothetical protein
VNVGVTPPEGGVVVTDAEREVVPPVPVQASVKVLMLESGPVDCEPLIALEPDQAPEAVQLDASADDQLSIEACPSVTEVGFALNVTVGAGGGAAVTVTVVFAEALPPVPVQESVNVVLALNVPVLCEPLVALEPDQPPEAVQLDAFVEDQLSVED